MNRLDDAVEFGNRQCELVRTVVDLKGSYNRFSRHILDQSHLLHVNDPPGSKELVRVR